jgi:hypothetical protein
MKILLILLTAITIIAVSTDVRSDDNNATNTSGSNTIIDGNYETNNTNTYQSGSSNDTTSTTTNNTTNSTSNKSNIPPPSANAPSYSSMSQDVCSMGISGSVTTSLVGVSAGKHHIDENCERIKLAKVLKDFGMSVAAVAILCQDERVFAAMMISNTPCPAPNGLLGDDAIKFWKTYPLLRPDYETYIKNEEYMASIRIEKMCENCNDPFAPIIPNIHE